MALSLSEREVLPTNVRPTHYDLRVEPDMEEAKEFAGQVVIYLDVVENTSSISLNMCDLVVSDSKVFTTGGEEIQVTETSYVEETEVMTFTLKKQLAVGAKVTLQQTYTGSLLHHAVGLYRSPVEGPNGPGWMLSTFMQPTDARKVLPCFDEPALKATFGLTLIADNEYTCLGNMDVKAESIIMSQGKEKKEVIFNNTPPMSTYLVSLAVGNLKMIETSNFRVPVRVYAAVDKNIEHGRFCLDLAARTLQTFETIFDIDFPLPKMDLIAVPTARGAMENWGLIVFDERLLLIDEKESSAQALHVGGGVLVHELAHQWFGNIVTMDFWEGLWLNEGFADWAEIYALEIMEPSWLMWQAYAVDGYERGLKLDSNKASHPIEVPVKRASEINQIFDDISYCKGCAVIRMIAKFLGQDVFLKGVQNYLKRHAFGNTTTNDLWDSLGQVSGKDVRTIMEKWTKNIGYPVVDVTESVETGMITITQHRFFQDGSSDPEDDQFLYPLNLGLRTAKGLAENETFSTRSTSIEVPLDFYKLDADHNGFYRVSYTPERLKILGQNAKDGLLSPEDRIGILSDSLAMASSGHSGAKTSSVFELLEQFEEESNFFVWEQIFTTISAIEKTFMFEDSLISKSIRMFKTRLMNNCLKKKGWQFNNSDDGVELMFKAKLFANGDHVPEVRDAAKNMFVSFIDGEEKAVNVNIQRPVFAIVLKHGGSKEYDAILEASRTASSADKRDACLVALGASEDPLLLSRTLQLSLSAEIMGQNATFKLLNSLNAHRPGVEALWSYFKENLPLIHKSFGESMGIIGIVLQICTTSLSTQEQWKDVQAFFAEKDTESYSSLLAQSLDRIQSKANWVDRDREDVRQWLNDHGYTQAEETV